MPLSWLFCVHSYAKEDLLCSNLGDSIVEVGGLANLLLSIDLMLWGQTSWHAFEVVVVYLRISIILWRRTFLKWFGEDIWCFLPTIWFSLYNNFLYVNSKLQPLQFGLSLNNLHHHQPYFQSAILNLSWLRSKLQIPPSFCQSLQKHICFQSPFQAESVDMFEIFTAKEDGTQIIWNNWGAQYKWD